jgi:hypothetical protein
MLHWKRPLRKYDRKLHAKGMEATKPLENMKNAGDDVAWGDAAIAYRPVFPAQYLNRDAE